MTTVNGTYQRESSSPFSNGQWIFGANGIGVDASRNTGAFTVNELARSRVETQDISANGAGVVRAFDVCIDGVTTSVNFLTQP
jgi:hypothetical protein